MPITASDASDGPSLAPIESRTLADTVAERIVEAIADASIRPGSRLVETELALAMGVSRVPVRDALRALEKQGIVVSAPYRGARVMAIGVDDIRQVFDTRYDLETRAVDGLVGRLKRGEVAFAPIESALAGLEAAVEAGDRRAYGIADLDFHRALCRASGNHIVITLWEALSHHVRIMLGLMEEDWQDRATSLSQHRGIAAMIAAGDTRGLPALMRQHMFGGFPAVIYDAGTGMFRRRRPDEETHGEAAR